MNYKGISRRLMFVAVLATVAGCQPAVAPVPNPNALQIPLGRFVLIRSGNDTVALTLTQHTTTADGGTKYVWHHLGDGTTDFSKGNVTTGTGEVFERNSRTRTGLSTQVLQNVGGQYNVKCGPYSIEWSQDDWLYFLSGHRVAVTPWTQLEDINVDDPKIDWQTFQ